VVLLASDLASLASLAAPRAEGEGEKEDALLSAPEEEGRERCGFSNCSIFHTIIERSIFPMEIANLIMSNMQFVSTIYIHIYLCTIAKSHTSHHMKI
jgi:hypothetical protein